MKVVIKNRVAEDAAFGNITVHKEQVAGERQVEAGTGKRQLGQTGVDVAAFVGWPGKIVKEVPVRQVVQGVKESQRMKLCLS